MTNNNDYKNYIDELKERITLSEVIARTAKLTLVRHGKYISTREHDSLQIDDERGWYVWYSRESQKGGAGDVLTWLQHHAHMAWREAVDYLATITGLRYTPKDGGTGGDFSRFAATNEANLCIARWLYRNLLNNQRAILYAHGRGWKKPEIEQARIGFWNGDHEGLKNWLLSHDVDLSRPEVVAWLGFCGDVEVWCKHWGVDSTLLGDACKDGKITPITSADLLVYTHFEKGRVTYFSSRRLDVAANQTKSYNLRSALVGSKKAYFNHCYSRGSDRVVIVEGQADAITLGKWGMPAVALAGASASDALVEQIKRHHILYVALDNDLAGLKGATKLAERLGPATQIVTWPDGGDANDWDVKHGASADMCKALLASAPIFALWYARRHHQVPELERERAKRYSFELIASLLPYDYAANARLLAEAMGGIDTPMRVSELNAITRAIKIERDLASKGSPDVKVEIANPSPGKKGHGRTRWDLLDEATRDILISESRDHEGHARCAMKLFGDQIAFVPAWGWVAYNGKNWEINGGDHRVEGLVVETLKARRHFAVEKELEELVRATACSDRNVRSTQRMMEKFAICKPSDFDAEPELLNCANGTINLRTGCLQEHTSADRLLHCIPTNYDPNADFSDWFVFLHSILAMKDVFGQYQCPPDILDFVQMAVGYSLTGVTNENCLFYLYGPTRSGKGTFLQTLTAMLGNPISGTLDLNVLTMERDGDAQNFALAPFQPCRIIVANEPGKYERFNEAKMKQLTGDDSVRCSFKRKDHFEYQPKFKIWISANWPFNADPLDDAAWGRVRLIHFPNSFLGSEDKTLKSRLQSTECIQGVLRWAVDGAVKWFEEFENRQGLVQPIYFKELADNQRNEQDFLQQFLDECMVTADKNSKNDFLAYDALASAYHAWCKEIGTTELKGKNFSQGLTAKGFVRGREYDGTVRKRGFYGLKLHTPPPSNTQQQGALFGDSRTH